MRWTSYTLAGLALLPCCSSGSHPCVGAADGTVLSVGGISFVQRSMTALEFADNFAEIVVSAVADACSDGAASHGGSLLDFQINRAAVGTHCVATPESGRPCAWAWVETNFPPDGGPGTTAVEADHGSVTLTVIDYAHIAGSYKLHFTTGEEVAGAFDAPTCNVGVCSP